MHWLMAFAGYKPVIESGDGLITGSLMQPQAPATCSTKVLGVNFKIVNEAGEEATFGEVKLSVPVLGRDEEACENIAYQALPHGYFRTSDASELTEK